jgi:hypothetical protein
MDNEIRLKQIGDIQAILGVDIDGKWGPKSQAALDAITHPKVEKVGDSTWDFLKPRIDGDDIVIDPGVVTAFGGADDKMDSGETASGISTKDNPSFIGCALPMNRDSIALRGSPIPKLPWKTTVIFTDPRTNTSVSTKLIDEGPARWTMHIGDLTEAAAKLFDPNATANNFEKTLSIRIVGGAKYVKAG